VPTCKGKTDETLYDLGCISFVRNNRFRRDPSERLLDIRYDPPQTLLAFWLVM
jgi:hypothetical protein